MVQDGKKTEYAYDALGQLTQVDDQQENATWVYTYDQGGNILSKKKYAYGVTTGEPTESKAFTYGNAKWKDQLTAVNGTPITYDAIGNPLSDGEWTYTWQNGRQLARMQKTGVDASFVYNENGLRVQKTVNGVTTDYTLHGKNIVHMKQGSNNLHFFYDAQGRPAVVVYNGTAYSYAKNLQGDIVAILNSSGTAVVRYVYDAWGRPISCTGTMTTTLGKLNPFRYRGYVYDEETELYYLRSRYYNPHRCRFVNSDNTVVGNIILGQNQYLYSKNDPIQYGDEDGTFWKRIAGIVVGAVTVVASITIAAVLPNPLGMAAAGAVMGFGTEIGSALLLDKETSVADVLSATASGAIGGLLPAHGLPWSFLRSFLSATADALIREGVDMISTNPKDTYSFNCSEFLFSIVFSGLGDGVGCFLDDKIDAFVSEVAFGGSSLQPRHYRQMAALQGRRLGRKESKRLRRYIQQHLIPTISEYAQTHASFYYDTLLKWLENLIK